MRSCTLYRNKTEWGKKLSSYHYEKISRMSQVKKIKDRLVYATFCDKNGKNENVYLYLLICTWRNSRRNKLIPEIIQKGLERWGEAMGERMFIVNLLTYLQIFWTKKFTFSNI